MPVSAAYRNLIVDHIFRTASFTKPTQLHIGLFTALGEVPGFGYVRYQHNPSNANWNRPSDGTISNAVDLIFPDPVGGSWGQIIEARLFDQDGTEIARTNLTQFRTVNSGDPGPKFSVGSMTFTIPG